MKEQPLALQLADALDAWNGKLMMPPGWREHTSDELRRLHGELTEQARLLGMSAERELDLLARLARLEKLNNQLLDVLKDYHKLTASDGWYADKVSAAIDKAGKQA